MAVTHYRIWSDSKWHVDLACGLHYTLRQRPQPWWSNDIHAVGCPECLAWYEKTYGPIEPLEERHFVRSPSGGRHQLGEDGRTLCGLEVDSKWREADQVTCTECIRVIYE